MIPSSVFSYKISPIYLSSTTRTSSNINSKSSITIPIPKNSKNRIRPAKIPQISRYNPTPITKIDDTEKSRVLRDTLRLLEWDKLCDIVASFAQTPLGRDATKERLSSLDQTYADSLRLLNETRAAVEIQKYDHRMLNFHRIDVLLVKSAINHAASGPFIDGREALAVARLLQFMEALREKIKQIINKIADLSRRFKPIDEFILDWDTMKPLVQSILEVINDDGSIKDSAIPELIPAREQVALLNDEVYQLVNSLIAKETNGALSLKAARIYGRWCILSGTAQLPSLEGILVLSGAGMGNIIEPVSAKPLNNELEEAEAYVAELEAKVLLGLTKKMNTNLDGLQELLKSIVELDVVNARASYSISMGGILPELLVHEDENAPLASEALPCRDKFSRHSCSIKKKWRLYMLKAYHPLLLQHHRNKLQRARQEVAWSTNMGFERYCQFRKKNLHRDGEPIDPQLLREKVTRLEKERPVPVDFVIDKDTRVVLVSGPNTGGKTVCLKTLGLAAIMAKAGLYVLCSEPAQIPWFDHVFADIGDQQSLSYSLSTFSGHLWQIGDILAKSTSQSLVLLDEIGAGTNPQEGAALGRSILESFSVAGALLTVATTHHGELKTLKYCHDSPEVFENACMEFDEVNLRPTYKILWGAPGRSNAINIAERLGLLEIIVSNARKLYGAASLEIDEIIYETEKFKKDVEGYASKAHHYLMLSKDLLEKLLLAQQKLTETRSDLTCQKMQQIYKMTSTAHLTLQQQKQEYLTFARQMAVPNQPIRECLEPQL